MIFHINLFTLKPGLSDEQREAGLDLSSAGSSSTAPCTWSRTSTATGRT